MELRKFRQNLHFVYTHAAIVTVSNLSVKKVFAIQLL